MVARGLEDPSDVVVLSDGDYAVTSSRNHRVMRASAEGRLTTLAGTGRPGFSGDGGPALEARFNSPTALAISNGELLVVDSGNRVVRLVRPDGTITTVAGRGPVARSGPTPATGQRLRMPRGVAGMHDGGFAIAEPSLVWAVRPDGSIRRLAGTGTPGFNRDLGNALATRLDQPAGLATGPDGAILLADTRNHRIRRITTAGQAETVAGSDRPNVKLAPIVRAPFRAVPVRLPRSQRPRAYAPAISPRPAPAAGGRRAPTCGRGTTSANFLVIQPYTKKLIRSATRPVVIRFGTSVNVSVRGYAWRRDGRIFGSC